MSVVVIANVRARGLLRRAERLAWLRSLSRGRAVVHETSSVAELAALAPAVAAADPDLVILAGGDGTFMSGVTALAPQMIGRPWPRVALLPLGTVGTIARNLGDRRAPEVLLEEWLAAPLDAPAIPRATLAVEATIGAAVERRVGFIVGTGLVARFFEVYEAEGAGGVPHAGRIVARVFVESFAGGPVAKRVLTPIPCRLEVDGETQRLTGVSLLCAAVVRDLGLSMKVCYRAGEDPERIHLVASGLDPFRLGPRAPLVMLGRTIGGEGHVDRLARSFRVRFPAGGGPYVLDGDSFHADTFEVTPGPMVPIIGPSLSNAGFG